MNSAFQTLKEARRTMLVNWPMSFRSRECGIAPKRTLIRKPLRTKSACRGSAWGWVRRGLRLVLGMVPASKVDFDRHCRSGRCARRNAQLGLLVVLDSSMAHDEWAAEVE